MNETYVSVITQELITCGTLLGPLTLTSGAPDSLAVLTWRCVDKIPHSKQILKVSLKEQTNGKNSSKVPSWLSHILPARNPEEQTLEVVVKSGQLYFRALKDVVSGEELKAWFGQDLAEILKLPMIPPNVFEGEKRYECMLCQEQFENPFPVVAHLMYRCRRKDQGIGMVPNPFRRKNGGRVKNFDIATLTDMNVDRGNDDNCPETPPSSSNEVSRQSDFIPESQIDVVGKRKKKSEHSDDDSSPTKKPKFATELKCNEGTKSLDAKILSSNKSQNHNFKLSSNTGSVYSSLLCSSTDANVTEQNSTSAFKKVDKSSISFHSNIGSVSTLFPRTLDPRDLLFQTNHNNFSSFHYMPPATRSPPCVGVTFSQSETAGLQHSAMGVPSLDVHMTSAFAPSVKLATSITSTTSNIHHQLKMVEECKLMRKMPNLPDSSYELNSLMSPNGARMSTLSAAGLHYAPKPQALENFNGNKGFPTPLLPFLPPSLAALSFPTQNWCAKCNASFRMTSDLVYHMRSHHKKETDPQKLKREEKLRCNICNETFRERHHLTRHMTSHQ
ncbi:uncharacterized protein LOC129235155 [Uloborus diversus]|uniref:uncharacterized protein LOC129235155 n=1 Tax=Uloborus diversus TaxID=327109 RepID=UPI00240962AD|nr:uncharacterized protein LOC129235155 [Uloborus diversus]